MGKELIYFVISSNDPDKFILAVDNMMRDGWKPQGGVCVTTYSWENEREGYTETGRIYYQAMVKE